MSEERRVHEPYVRRVWSIFIESFELEVEVLGIGNSF